ncbi:MAG: VPLPA-CTERM sorting domain-containing protein [bacterium]
MTINIKAAIGAAVVGLAMAQSAAASSIETYSYTSSYMKPFYDPSDSSELRGTGSLVQSGTLGEASQTSQVRVDETVGASSSSAVTDPYGGPSGAVSGPLSHNSAYANGSASVIQRFVLGMEEIQGFGDWNIDFNYDGTLTSVGNADASYNLSANAYLVSDYATFLSDNPFYSPEYEMGYAAEGPGGDGVFGLEIGSFGAGDSVYGTESKVVDDSGSLEFNLAESAADYFDALVIELSLDTYSSASIYSQGSGDSSASADFLNTFSIGGVGGAGSGNAGNFGVTPVPVPAAVYFLGSGLIAFMGLRRRKLGVASAA